MERQPFSPEQVPFEVSIMAKLPTLTLENILVATYVSPGVTNDGGGFIIVNGKFRRIPPRSPSMKKLTAALRALNDLDEIEGAEEMQEAAQKMIMAAVEELA
jgi:predicted DNA-binding transcriptional regulator YafY